MARSSLKTPHAIAPTSYIGLRRLIGQGNAADGRDGARERSPKKRRRRPFLPTPHIFPTAEAYAAAQ